MRGAATGWTFQAKRCLFLALSFGVRGGVMPGTLAGDGRPAPARILPGVIAPPVFTCLFFPAGAAMTAGG